MTKKVTFDITSSMGGGELFISIFKKPERSGYMFASDDGITGTGTFLKEWEVDVDESIRLIEKYAYEEDGGLTMGKKITFNITRPISGRFFIGIVNKPKRSGYRFASNDGVSGTGTILKEWELDADEAVRLIKKYAYEVED